MKNEQSNSNSILSLKEKVGAWTLASLVTAGFVYADIRSANDSHYDRPTPAHLNYQPDTQGSPAFTVPTGSTEVAPNQNMAPTVTGSIDPTPQSAGSSSNSGQ
jgi:hypothetical protein